MVRGAAPAERVAIRRGVRQYVVLGAGFDTFAYRNPFAADGLVVFEIDHPVTQQVKRRRLGIANIEENSSGEESRYEVTVAETVARDMYAAVTDSTNGVLTWLKKHW